MVCAVAGDVVVGNSVELGINSVVLPGLRICDGACVGAGALVTKDVEPGVVVIGSPARPRGQNP
jgi:virginiamycin A acetyltransferase